MMRGVLAVFRKETKDHLRDRRSLLSGLMMPLMGPLMFAAMLTLISSWARQEGPVEIPMVGMKNAASLVTSWSATGPPSPPRPTTTRPRSARAGSTWWWW